MHWRWKWGQLRPLVGVRIIHVVVRKHIIRFTDGAAFTAEDMKQPCAATLLTPPRGRNIGLRCDHCRVSGS